MNGVSGFISLDLSYGEIMEEIVELFLEHCHCKSVFTGGAGGYISGQTTEERPSIGDRVVIKKSMNEQGEIAEVGNAASAVHLQIPSIFLKTYEWLADAQKRGSSVDVETFYILRAIMHHNEKHSNAPVKADCGFFVSDYVGEQALREYSKVYQKYSQFLAKFLQDVLSMV